MKGKLKEKRYRWRPSECIYFFNRQQHDQCLLVSSLNSAKIKGAGTLMMTHGKSRSISYFPFNVSRDHLIFGLWSFGHSNVRLFFSLSHSSYGSKTKWEKSIFNFQCVRKKSYRKSLQCTGWVWLAKGKDDKNGWLVKLKHDLWGHFQPAHHIYHLPLLKHLKSLLTNFRPVHVLLSRFYPDFILIIF